MASGAIMPKDFKLQRELEMATLNLVAGRWELLGAPLSIHDRVRFLEDAFLCGFQTAQRVAGLSLRSPEFIVDVHIELARRQGHPTGEIRSWRIRRKNGTSDVVKFKAVCRSNKPPAAKRGKSTKANAQTLLGVNV